MNEFVYVEFIFDGSEAADGLILLEKLGDDFILMNQNSHFELEDGVGGALFGYIVTGKIKSEAATILKLTHPKIGERMRISHISAELKDKYRS